MYETTIGETYIEPSKQGAINPPETTPRKGGRPRVPLWARPVPIALGLSPPVHASIKRVAVARGLSGPAEFIRAAINEKLDREAPGWAK